MRIAGKATKGKGKRWAKGGSSSSNPENKKHRLQAKSLTAPTDLTRPHSQQSLRLTEDALNQHNLTQLQKLSLSKNSLNVKNEVDAEVESVGAQSFATVWTNCSNVSFNKLLLRFDSSSAVHKQMLAVLAAITETIHANGGKETETEYFAALMTSLESVDNEENLTAILSLIQMVIKRLPPNVIRAKFSEASKVLIDYLAKYIKGDNGLIVRSLITSVSQLLLQQESAVWELSSTKNIFEIILSLSIHSKPRIRKCAQKSIARILRSNPNQSINALYHPMAKLTADFCIRKIEESATNDNINAVLYILILLSDILSVLPNSSLKKCAEVMLTQMTFGNVLIVSTAFKAFYLLFSAQPNPNILTPELNAKLISALYDYQPNINDSQPLIAWLQTIQKAFTNLYRTDKRLCFNHLPKLFETGIGCLLSDAKEVHSCVATCLKQIYTDCIHPSIVDIDKFIVQKIYASLEKSLEFEYCNAWSPLFGLISHMFNEKCSELTAQIMSRLVVIRESYDCVYASDIDSAIGTAVQVFGPEYVLKFCSLNLNEENNDVSHNWLLPVLKDNIKDSELSLFGEYFIPLSNILETTCNSLESEGNQITAKTCAILVSQIWSLLPSFCIHPKDFDKSFRRIAQTLGTILSNKPSFRSYVFMAFKNLSKSFDNPLIPKELSKFSKNFIPILFNIYTNEMNINQMKNQGFAVYEVIQIFLSISDSSLIQIFYTKLLEKLKNESNNAFTRQSLMDLIRAFVPYVTKENIKYIYDEIAMPFVQSNEHTTEQKKAFRIIEEICKSDSNVCQEFFKESSQEIMNMLFESIDRCLSSSKAYILKSLKELIAKYLDNESFDWANIFPQITVKTLNCLSINSRKMKNSALDLLVCITNGYKTIDGKPDRMFETLVGFLVEKQHSSSAVINTLNHLYLHYRSQIPKHIECNIIENIVLSIGSDNRQTIQASIEFLKYFFRNASADQLSTYLELIINNLSSIDRKHKNHFRMKVKQMFIRLVRKYGYLYYY